MGRPLARYDRSIDVHLSSIRHKLGGGKGARRFKPCVASAISPQRNKHLGPVVLEILFAFWLALLIASGGVGTTVWLHRQTQDDHDRALAGGPRTAFW